MMLARTRHNAALLPGNRQLYIELNSAPGTQTREIVEVPNIHLYANEVGIEVDIDNASG